MKICAKHTYIILIPLHKLLHQGNEPYVIRMNRVLYTVFIMSASYKNRLEGYIEGQLVSNTSQISCLLGFRISQTIFQQQSDLILN